MTSNATIPLSEEGIILTTYVYSDGQNNIGTLFDTIHYHS